jgi:hypothetical protein
VVSPSDNDDRHGRMVLPHRLHKRIGSSELILSGAAHAEYMNMQASRLPVMSQPHQHAWICIKCEASIRYKERELNVAAAFGNSFSPLIDARCGIRSGWRS